MEEKIKIKDKILKIPELVEIRQQIIDEIILGVKGDKNLPSELISTFILKNFSEKKVLEEYVELYKNAFRT